MTGIVSLITLKIFHTTVLRRVKAKVDQAFWGLNKYWQYLSLDHILLKKLESEAPGTMRHSLMVGSMAAAAAFCIRADADLARVIGYFHDIAKGDNPHLFFEALSGKRSFSSGQRHKIEINTIEELTIIMSHAQDSARILRAQGFPEEVCLAVSQHHGNMMTRVRLSKKLQKELAGKEKVYLQYIGQRPTSKESAIVMLADGAEAIVNRKWRELCQPASLGQDFIRIWVNEIGRDLRQKGQLNNSSLSEAEQAIVEEKIVWWLYKFYNHLDISGYPSHGKADQTPVNIRAIPA